MIDKDKVIQLAKEAGFRSGQIDLSNGGKIPFIAPVSATDCKNELERFAQAIYRQGLEDAAKVAEAMHEEDRPSDYAYAIRAHAQNQPKPIHDSSVVSKK